MPGFRETASDKKDRVRFETEDDLRTLVKAKEIGSDESRVKRAMTLAKKQMTELEQVRDA